MKLTILITTYNRKERLLNMLHSIERQKMYDKCEIIISDNSSNYDVDEVVKQNFNIDFYNTIRIHRWAFNTGMSTNMSVSFTLVNTDWCLYLSDDDEMTDNSLAKIINDIQENPNAIAIKYSLTRREPYPDLKIKTLEELEDYYTLNKNKVNEFFYLSRVYNLKLLRNYISYLTEYSYTYISFIIPLIFALRDKVGYILTSSFQNINYIICPANENWFFNERYVKTFLGIITIEDILICNANYKSKKRLLSIIFSYISTPHLIKCIEKNISKEERLSLFKKIYHAYSYHHIICKYIPARCYYNYILFKIKFNSLKETVKGIIRK